MGTFKKQFSLAVILLSMSACATTQNKDYRNPSSATVAPEIFNDKDCSIYAKFVISRIEDANWSYSRLANGGGSTTFSPEPDFAEGSGNFLAYDKIESELLNVNVESSADSELVNVRRTFDLFTMSEAEQPKRVFLGRVTLTAKTHAMNIKKYPPYGSSSSGHCTLEKIEFAVK